MPPIPDPNEQSQLKQEESKLKKQKKPGRYRLLEGMHVGDNGEHYDRGSIVQTHVDLVERFGAEKFQCLAEPEGMKDADPAPPASTVQTSFPAGQVHSGKQATTTLPGGERVSGPEDSVSQQVENAGAQPDEKEETQTAPKKASAQAAKAIQAKATPEQIAKAQQKPAGKEGQEGEAEDLGKYSVAELKKLAEEDEIDLAGCKTKEEIIARIKES